LKVLPIVIYFSAITYLFYYLGWMQLVIIKVAWLLQVTMGTSPAESVNAAGNIFIGQVCIIRIILFVIFYLLNLLSARAFF